MNQDQVHVEARSLALGVNLHFIPHINTLPIVSGPNTVLRGKVAQHFQRPLDHRGSERLRLGACFYSTPGNCQAPI